MARLWQWCSRAAGAVALAACLARSLPAQGIASAMLAGTVYDQRGEPVTGATVRLLAAGAGIDAQAETGINGEFSLPGLVPGRYDLLVEQLSFRPQRLVGIPVRAGRDLRVDVTLNLAAAGLAVDTVVFPGGATAGSRPGLSQWLGPIPTSGLPDESRGVGLLASMATSGNGSLEVEGLPSQLSGLAVDGLLQHRARGPGNIPGDLGGPPILALDAAELVENGGDVEWGGLAGGYLSTYTRPGAPRGAFRARADWGGSSLHASPAGLSPADATGAAFLAGGTNADSVRFAVGLEGARLERGVSAAPGSSAATIAGATNAFGSAVSGLNGGVVRNDVARGSGRLDVQLRPGARVEVRAVASTFRMEAPGMGAVSFLSDAAGARGTDVSLAAGIFSRAGATLFQELHLGIGHSSRQLGMSEPQAATTFFSDPGLAVGPVTAIRGTLARTSVDGRAALTIPTDRHRFKLGVDAAVGIHSNNYLAGDAGTFIFGGASSFAAGRGAFLQRSGASETSFTQATAVAFLQDTWSAVPGLDVQYGLRTGLQHLGTGAAQGNLNWEQLSGLKSSAPSNVVVLSPRVSAAWDVQRLHTWLVKASAGVDEGEADPAVLHELNLGARDISVRSMTGNVGWPAAPGQASTSFTGTQLAIAGQSFRAPRTTRGSLGLARQLGQASLVASAVLRHTDRLPQRRDLNLTPSVASVDQYGRAVHGALVQVGDLIVAQPGSNRRFAGFDVVSGFDADATSDYAGFTAGLERFGGERAQFFARYTYSTTRDNWTWARYQESGLILPLATDTVAGQPWAQGRSDFDVPQRLTAGIELAPKGVIQAHIVLLYRQESGFPYTPGFGPGVDANGDGWIGNDPAFVDPAISGMSDLLSRNSCLRTQEGRFVERNSCRAPTRRSLDLRAELGLLRLGRAMAAVAVDAIGLISSNDGPVDTALLLGNGSATLTGAGTATVHVPLVANPHFGQQFATGHNARVIRVGFNLSY